MTLPGNLVTPDAGELAELMDKTVVDLTAGGAILRYSSAIRKRMNDGDLRENEAKEE